MQICILSQHLHFLLSWWHFTVPFVCLSSYNFHNLSYSDLFGDLRSSVLKSENFWEKNWVRRPWTMLWDRPHFRTCPKSKLQKYSEKPAWDKKKRRPFPSQRWNSAVYGCLGLWYKWTEVQSAGFLARVSKKWSPHGPLPFSRQFISQYFCLVVFMRLHYLLPEGIWSVT